MSGWTNKQRRTEGSRGPSGDKDRAKSAKQGKHEVIRAKKWKLVSMVHRKKNDEGGHLLTHLSLFWIPTVGHFQRPFLSATLQSL